MDNFINIAACCFVALLTLLFGKWLNRKPNNYKNYKCKCGAWTEAIKKTSCSTCGSVYIEEGDRPTKQVIVVRRDLKMRRGKEIAQASHASLAFLTRKIATKNIKLSHAVELWLDKSFAKVCLKVNSEQELKDIRDQAIDACVEVHLITDSGRTEFHGVPTKTCLAIGPDYCDRIDPITQHLSLM